MTNSDDNRSSLSAAKQALLKIRELKQKLAEAQIQRYEPIAIVSAACRFPRRSHSPEAFWQSLAAGNDQIDQVPPDRWDRDAYYDEDPDAVGRMYTLSGGFVEGADQMDAEFFGISPREASWIDPQQRLLMEVCWEALERAAWAADRIGPETGVFVGWMHNDYQNECSDSLSNLNPYIATGSAGSFLCGRLSYQLGLQGPSLAVDTACSSSLVALHAACQSLMLGQCDRAIVGGVNYMASPKTFVLTCKLRALSPHGYSHAFDASADGYVRGEGCGVVTLRRLADAQRDGDPILAVIRGSAVGHNGAGSGLTAPNPQSQEKVIAAALEQAGIEPSQVDYLEAHGTGTELGDPIELRAAATVLGAGRPADRPLLVGSVKTNIGHLEAAAGIAGLIKVVLALQNEQIPRHLHFENPNPHIDWESIPLKVVVENTPWPAAGQRIAGVSAFGMSGTNAHVVLEGPPPVEQRINIESESHGNAARSPHLLVLSGRSQGAVSELAGRYRRWLEDRPEADLADVGFTAATGRRHFEHRAALVVESSQHAQAELRNLELGKAAGSVLRGTAARQPKVAWQFPGQGSQYLGMARALYDSQPVFRAALDRCDAYLREIRGQSLLEVMFEREALLNQTTWTQPAMFALEMGLAQLLEAWGLRPDIVLGHSVGQFAAAAVAGIFDWEEGLQLISRRSQLVGNLPAGGAMAAVFARPAEIQQVVAQQPHLSVAAFNGAHSVISGREQAVAAALDRFAEQGIRCKRLATSHAFHSPLMDPLAESMREAAGRMAYRPPQLPLICNVTGKPLPPEEILDGEYWWRHLREPVQYAQSIASLDQLGCDVLLELGPQPTLTGIAAGCLRSAAPAMLACLARDRNDTEALLTAVGKLYTLGATPDFAAFGWPGPRRRLQLPTYPFQRQPFWGPAKPQAFQAESGRKHPLLGTRRSLAGLAGERRWENWVAADNPRWLDDHRVLGDAVLPGAAYVEMALSVADRGQELRDIIFEVPLRLANSTCMQTIRRNKADAPDTIEIHSSSEPDGPWTRNFTATCSVGETKAPGRIDLQEILSRCTDHIEADEFYQSLHGRGLQYGRQFQTIGSVHRGDGEVVTRLQLQGDVRGCLVPPVLLDGAFQSLAAFLADEPEETLFLPVGMERVQCFHAVEGDVYCHARWTIPQGEQRSADLTILGPDHRVLVEVTGLKLRQANRSALRRMAGTGSERLMYAVQWRDDYLTETVHPGRSNWLVFEGLPGQAADIAARLEKQGQRCVRVALAEDGSQPRYEQASCSIPGEGPQDWSELLDRYFPDEAESQLDGVVWLAGTSAAAGESLKAQIAETKRGCSSLLGLLHALRARKVERLVRGLQIVTQLAVPVAESDRVTARMAQYWGLGRVMASEHPVYRCRLIDVENLSTDVPELVEILLCESRENQIALRSGRQHVARLAPIKPAPADRQFAIESEASYLITGGLGALGLQAARWLAGHGAGHVVLVSRRAADEAVCRKLAEIEELGTRVVVVSADISSSDDVARLFDTIARDLPPLKGVVHAAGVLDDGMLGDQSWSRFETVLAPKQLGGWLLHRFTAELSLDFFILYSSAASILGSPGQSSYATGNAFLDGLAQERVQAGLPALSVNWGPWQEGMAAAESISRALAQQGITPLSAEESHQVLEQLLAYGAVQATVLDADWGRMWQRFAGAVPRMLEELAPPAAGGTFGESVLLEKMRATPAAERPQMLTEHVQREIQEILSLREPPAADAPLAELGLDSLMAVELSNRLQQQLGADFAIPPTLAFDYPSVDELSAHLLGLLEDLPEEVDEPVTIGPEVQGDEVAIIGMGCRFPGAGSLGEYWRMLRDGVDAVGEIPADRWDVDKYYSPTPEPGKMYTREGGFLPDVDRFDAEFFGISGPEACWMDPQHRLLLEVSWEALEDAGIASDRLDDRRVGVFVGIMSHDYSKLAPDDVDSIAGFQGAGLSHSAGVGRLSYWYGFQGPSIAVDTASSSSLVAVSQAARSLLSGECNLALAGGVNTILTPTNSLLLCKAGMLAPDGRCKSFSADADGFSRGEGCGLIVMKRLADARRDGDRILAVIRSSSVSHNGASGGVTVPSARSQQRMIREAIQQAGLQPAEIQYLEAHGTGTKLGDTIEMQAAAGVLAQGRHPEQPLIVGSAKANIGHLESAGGVSGLIKAVLCLQHNEIPRQLHFEQPSPDIPWGRLAVKVPTTNTAWPSAVTRTAAVTALGMSGTNAHVIISDPPAVEAVPGGEPSVKERPCHLMVLSGRTHSALQRTAERLAGVVSEIPSEGLADACYTAAVGRRHFEHRAALAVDSVEQLALRMNSILAQPPTGGAVPGQAARAPKIGWVFSSSETFAAGVGRQLYQTQPVFREAIDLCDATLEPLSGDKISSGLLEDHAGNGRRHRPTELMALQMALARLWTSWGVEADVVWGHGWSHYAAACAAGVMNWEDGLRLAAERLRLQGESEPANESEEFGAALEKFADTIDYFPADRPLICNLSGRVVPEFQLLAGSYWRRHACEPLQQEKAAESLRDLQCDILVEIGPAATAASLGSKISAPLVSSLVAGRGETESLLQALGQLYVAGVTPDFAAFDRPWPRRKVGLPTYPFQRRRYWITEVAQHAAEPTEANASPGGVRLET